MDAVEYKNVLCAALPGTPVAVASVEGKGNVLLARSAVSTGNFVFGEAPLGSQQYGRNKPLVRACEHCHRFIGTLEDQFEKLATVRLSTVHRSKLPPWEAKSIEKDFKKNFPSLKSFKCPMVDDSVIAPVVLCEWGCDAEYCSTQCRDEARRRYHALLCTGRPPAGAPAQGGGSNAAQASTVTADGDHTDHEHGADMEEEEEGEEEGEEEDEEEEEEEGDAHDHAMEVEDDEDVNAAALFEHQALSTNEVFLLAGRLIGRVLEVWARNGNDMGAAMKPLSTLHSAPWTSLFDLRQEADQKKALLEEEEEEGEDEEEDVEEEEDEEEEDPGALIAQVSEWLRDSLTILRALVKQRLPALVHACGRTGHSRTALEEFESDMLLAHETYSRLLGGFELNQIEMKIDSPVRDYLRSVEEAAGKGTPGAADAVAVLAPVLAQVERAYHARQQLSLSVAVVLGEEDDVEDEQAGLEADAEDEDAEGPLLAVQVPLKGKGGGGSETLLVMPSRFPVSDGTALYTLICTMNHSCEPNVQVMYAEGSHTGALVAQVDIAPGDELCINYIDTEQSKEARRLDLLHYGFTCECPKCERGE